MPNGVLESVTNSQLYLKYKILARNGHGFEAEMLGRESDKSSLEIVQKSFTESLVDIVDAGREVSDQNAKIQRILKCVKRKLSKFGINEDLKFYESINTSADIYYGIDAFFYIKREGIEYVVTLDALFFNEKELIDIVKEFMQEEFSQVKDKSHLALRHILSQHYLRFQSVLDGFKSLRKKEKLDSLARNAIILDWERYENHFIFTPIDIGGRCLRAFVTEIAASFHKQIKEREEGKEGENNP